MIKVKALDTYTKNNIIDNELKIIPVEGHEFEVTEERYKILNRNNKHNLKFVEKLKKDKTDNQGSE